MRQTSVGPSSDALGTNRTAHTGSEGQRDNAHTMWITPLVALLSLCVVGSVAAETPEDHEALG